MRVLTRGVTSVLEMCRWRPGSGSYRPKRPGKDLDRWPHGLPADLFLADNGDRGYGAAMKKVRLNELSDPVRSFLEQLRDGESIMVEDEDGQLQCGITPYYEASPAEKRRAQESLERIWEKTSRAMAQGGVTEEDIDRDLQADD